jgi:hypothetical protein
MHDELGRRLAIVVKPCDVHVGGFIEGVALLQVADRLSRTGLVMVLFASWAPATLKKYLKMLVQFTITSY